MFTVRLLLPTVLLCILSNCAYVFAADEKQITLTEGQKELLESKVRDVFAGTDANVKQGVSIASYGGTYGKWAFASEYSNKDKFEILDTSMVFEVGAITELFTAAAIMKLSEQGKLRLDHTISRFLPKYPAISEKITIEQLLLHKSGLRDYMNDIYLIQNVWERFPSTIHSPTKIPATLGDPLYEPGKQTMYSRTNYLVLALIVEAASGTTYAEYLRNVFFKPLDMKRTFVGYYETDSSRYMSGIVDTTFETWGGDMKDIPNTARYTIQFGIGNIISTPSEIAKWGYMLLSGRILQKKSLDKILSFSKDLKNEFIGAGVRKMFVNERPLYGVVSSLYGYESFVLYDSVNNISFCGVLNETHNKILFKSSLHTLYENVFDIFNPKKAEPYNLKFRKVSLYIDNNKMIVGRGDNVNGSVEFSDLSNNNSSVKTTIKVSCNDPDIKLLQSTFSERIYGQGRFHWFNILRFQVDKNAKLNRQVTFSVVVSPDMGTIIEDTFLVTVPLSGYGRSAYFKSSDSTAAVLRTIQNTHQLSSAFTLEACIKPSSEMKKNRYYSIAYYGYKIRCFVFNRSINLILWHNNSFSSLTTSDSILHYDIWQHIAVQWNGLSTPSIFINGKVVKTSSSYSTQYSGFFNDKMKVFVIGNTPSFNNSAQPFCGYIDNVRLWGKVRSEKQIYDNMKLTNPLDRNSLLIDATFDKIISVQEGETAEFSGLFEQCDFGEQYNSTSVKVNESEGEEQFRLYCHNGTLNINSDIPIYGKISVYTSLGEEIFSENMPFESGSYSIHLQNIIPNKWYVVRLLNDKYAKMFTVYNQ